MVFTNDLLFNCQPDCAEPDWNWYQVLEIAGCINTETVDGVEHVESGVPHIDSEFFGIYGVLLSGEAEAITDVGCWDTALAVLDHLSRSSGLSIRHQFNLQAPSV